MPHFFIKSENKENNIIRISDVDNYRHIAKSLRAKVGEKLLLIDENRIQYETCIKTINASSIECEIVDSYLSERDLSFDLYLAQAPLRSDAQNLVIEKATELGVRAVYPILTDNCSFNKDIIEKKVEKWNKIMHEASKQCERAVIPYCFAPITLEKLLNENNFDKIIVFAERYTDKSLKKYLTDSPIIKGEKILAIIGPEGGFSQREFDYFRSLNLPLVSLGDLILRAETAVVVALGDIVYEYQG